MQKQKLTYLIAVCAAAVLLLGGCGGNNAPTPPEAYAIGADSAPPVDELLGEGGGALVSASSGDLPDGDGGTQAEGAGEETAPTVFVYEGLPSGSETVRQYAEKLTSSAYGFSVVNDKGRAVPPPDYSGAGGSVLLARDSSEAGRLFTIRADWTQTGCTVAVSCPEGSLAREQPQGMTMQDAVDYLRSFSPASLQLAGDNMHSYSVFPKEGAVAVDGVPCLQLNVYSKSDAGTNDIAGAYLLTGDKAHLYKLSPDSGEVVEISAQPANGA